MSSTFPAQISIIIPSWNEAEDIATTLSALQHLRDKSVEIIVADGGSRDPTVALAQPLVDLLIHTGRGRAQQMNAGAGRANGNILLFLHADTRLPEHAHQLVAEGLAKTGRGWGRFDVRLSGRHPLLRLVERMMNWRSRWSGIATGDQALFVRRDWFENVGGFPVLPLMEDIALSRKLKRMGMPLCLHERVTTSSRRWERNGILRTILLMWRLRLAYALGADPQRLADKYYKS
ncbi:MAG: TIGR04283 family arsenosugar biosynthesis glycosyltransferase [Gammaproteobacteria bacterium]